MDSRLDPARIAAAARKARYRLRLRERARRDLPRLTGALPLPSALRPGATPEQPRQLPQFVPPGHYYSPIPSPEDIEDAFSRHVSHPPYPGVDLNEAGQLERLERFAEWYPELPFPEHPTRGLRYYLDNPSYAHFDAVMLYGMLREARPRRIVEVGSGLSSAAMLDLNEHLLGGRAELTFIDPDMSRLRPLLRPEDASRVTLIERRVQEVPLDAFAQLGENDVLFIDSSHVSKVGSDVNRLFFDVIPSLATGVLVHIHDVAYGLEYPREWLEEGRAWNEQYLLRAFLMYNAAFRVELYTPWIAVQHAAFLQQHMPIAAQRGGGQIWLRRIA